MGRFDRSTDGVPTLVPRSVLESYPLPTDAVIVDKDYVPPDARQELSPRSDMSVHEQETEINRRVNAVLALREAEERGRKMQGVADKADEIAASNAVPKLGLLEGNVADVKTAIEGLGTAEELQALLEEESSGQRRKGILIAIEARLEDLHSPVS